VNFLFYKYTALASREVDGYQMFSGGSIVGKSATIGIEISPTALIIFTGGQKCENWASFSTSIANHSNMSCLRLKTQQDIRTLKQTSCVAMIAHVLAKFGEVGFMHP